MVFSLHFGKMLNLTLKKAKTVHISNISYKYAQEHLQDWGIDEIMFLAVSA